MRIPERTLKHFLLVGLLAVGCSGRTLPPTGQVLVHIATDAPLPAAPGDRAPAITPLFDRIRLSLYEPGQTVPCDGCVSEFGVDSTQASAGKISFGVVPTADLGGYVAQVDMFRAVAAVHGSLLQRSTVTHFVALPPASGEGIVHVGVFLSVQEVGVPRGSLKTPEAAQPGEPDYTKTGSWPGAQRVPCSGAAKIGEVCVEGGAYWMGNPEVSDIRDTDENNIPHLVVVSPFYMDSTEVTVASYRASGLATVMTMTDPMTMTMTTVSVDPVDAAAFYVTDPSPPTWVTGATVSTGYWQSFCTYSTKPGANELMPLNCVSWSKAREYCRAKGSDLLSEAEFEYVGTGFASHLYSWGNDPPSCSDTVFARGGVGAFVGSGSKCDENGRSFGPLPPGSGALDRIQLPGGVIYDVVGNLSEWSLDQWNRSTEPCWTPPLLTDPVCSVVSPADGNLQSIRGGAWPTTLTEIQSAQRNQKAPDARAQTGIRCARPLGMRL